MSGEYVLDEWVITLVVRVDASDTIVPPNKWDYTELLDLATGKGEQAWVEEPVLVRASGTESELDA